MTLDEALQDVEIAFLQVEFTIKLSSYCELQKIDPSEFETDHVILLDEQNLHLPAEALQRVGKHPQGGRCRCFVHRHLRYGPGQGMGSRRNKPGSRIRGRGGRAANAGLHDSMRLRACVNGYAKAPENGEHKM